MANEARPGQARRVRCPSIFPLPLYLDERNKISARVLIRIVTNMHDTGHEIIDSFILSISTQLFCLKRC